MIRQRSVGGPGRGARIAALATILAVFSASADEVAEGQEDAAALWLATVTVDPRLQTFLDETVESLRASDAALQHQEIRVAVIDLPATGRAGLAHWNGESPVYPASVPKFVYLMAAYHWRDEGQLQIDSKLDRQLHQMVYSSSNRATQKVVARLTDTEPGPELSPEEYREFVEKRHAVKRWLRGLGVTGLHLVHPTYDGGGDLHGREVQFLRDTEVPGSLPNQTGEYRNRQAMTAVDTARLLALLATDRALSPESSAEVRNRMLRKTSKQGYLKYRIAGGAEEAAPGAEIYAKTGTWGPIFSDAGIVRDPSGHQAVVVVFLNGKPRYKGPFISRLTERSVRRMFEAKPESARGPPGNVAPGEHAAVRESTEEEAGR